MTKLSMEVGEKVLEVAPDPIVVIDGKGKIEEVNEAFYEKTGYEEKEIEGKGIEELPVLSDEDKKKVLQGYEMRMADQDIPEKLEFPYSIEYKTKDGEKRYAELNAKILKKEDKSKGSVAILRDITHAKKEEERREFLHSLLSHDVRNTISVTEGYLQLMEEAAEGYDLPDEIRKYLDKARKGTKKGLDKVQKVGRLSKVGEEELRPRDLNQVIENIIDKQRDLASEYNIEIEDEYDSYEVIAGGLLGDMFSNLIENSIKHSEGDRIRISTEEYEDEVGTCIEDDGKGIPDEEKGRIFERGYSKGKSGGSGLGMYFVKELVNEYQGSIDLTDSDLGGAKFDIRLKKHE